MTTSNKDCDSLSFIFGLIKSVIDSFRLNLVVSFSFNFKNVFHVGKRDKISSEIALRIFNLHFSEDNKYK